MNRSSLLKRVVVILLLIGVGIRVIHYSSDQETQQLHGYELYNAAVSALQAKDVKTAYVLFLQSAYESRDKQLQGTAFYEAASIGWIGKIADYRILVDLYQQALRYNPDLYEAGFDLEYLYWLKENNPQDLPQPEDSKQPGQKSKPGQQPGGPEVPNGDI